MPFEPFNAYPPEVNVGRFDLSLGPWTWQLAAAEYGAYGAEILAAQTTLGEHLVTTFLGWQGNAADAKNKQYSEYLDWLTKTQGTILQNVANCEAVVAAWTAARLTLVPLAVIEPIQAAIASIGAVGGITTLIPGVNIAGAAVDALAANLEALYQAIWQWNGTVMTVYDTAVTNASRVITPPPPPLHNNAKDVSNAAKGGAQLGANSIKHGIEDTKNGIKGAINNISNAADKTKNLAGGVSRGAQNVVDSTVKTGNTLLGVGEKIKNGVEEHLRFENQANDNRYKLNTKNSTDLEQIADLRSLLGAGTLNESESFGSLDAKSLGEVSLSSIGGLSAGVGGFANSAENLGTYSIGNAAGGRGVAPIFSGINTQTSTSAGTTAPAPLGGLGTGGRRSDLKGRVETIMNDAEELGIVKLKTLTKINTSS